MGHAAVALGATKFAPRLNVGWLVFAALLADFLLGMFAFAGLERAHVPPDYASRHYLTFTFPFSHGLVPLLLWGAIAGFLLSHLQRQDRWRVFLLVATVVLSHFLLDGLVHVVGLPLLGENSPKFGLGLWKQMPLELTLESLLALTGVVLYWKAAGSAPAWGRWGIAIFMAALTALTWTQLFLVTPPSPARLVPNWIVAPLVFAAIPYLLDRKRVAAAGLPASP